MATRNRHTYWLSVMNRGIYAGQQVIIQAEDKADERDLVRLGFTRIRTSEIDHEDTPYIKYAKHFLADPV